MSPATMEQMLLASSSNDDDSSSDESGNENDDNETTNTTAVSIVAATIQPTTPQVMTTPLPMRPPEAPPGSLVLTQQSSSSQKLYSVESAPPPSRNMIRTPLVDSLGNPRQIQSPWSDSKIPYQPQKHDIPLPRKPASSTGRAIPRTNGVGNHHPVLPSPMTPGQENAYFTPDQPIRNRADLSSTPRTPGFYPTQHSSGRSTPSTSAKSSSIISTPRGHRQNGASPEILTREQYELQRKKKQVQYYLTFFMKIVEKNDPNVHARALRVYQECEEKNIKQEPGYESLTKSVYNGLRDLVGEAYWGEVGKCFNKYCEHRKAQKEKAAKRQAQEQREPKLQEKKLLEETRKKQQEGARKKQQQAAVIKKAQHARKVAMELEKQRTKGLMEQQKRDLLARQTEEIVARKAQLVSELELGENHTSEEQMETVQKMEQESNKKRSSPTDEESQGKKRRGRPKKNQPTTPETRPKPRKKEMPPREYSKLMEMVDHAVTYDWTSSGTILRKHRIEDIDLDEEQHKLLYGEDTEKSSDSGNEEKESVSDPRKKSVLPLALQGWSERNVLSARSAWARIRLGELEREKVVETAEGMPVVAGFSLPRKPQSRVAKSPTSASVSSAAAWYNDEEAEEDKTLALLSEATEMYLKSILENAVQSARQRQNLDGIRLWHLQHNKSLQAPLAMRLGCDVRRQVAQAEGNAAKTTQRMEEALENQKLPAKNRDLNDDETLYHATSLTDLAMRPRLKSAAPQADLHAKRRFEIYGGKDSDAPPFGCVPKKVKIMPADFQRCVEKSSFPHQRTFVAASSFI